MKNPLKKTNGSRAVAGGNGARKPFGAVVRSLREETGLSQREMARRVGITAAYLSDIEALHRRPPSKEILQKMASELEVAPEELFDLVGLETDRIPPDVPEIVKTRPESVSLLRAIRHHQASSQQIQELTRRVGGAEMRAVILAAGMGTRLKQYTQDLPKCMAIVLNGKTLLETQMEALRACGITDLAVVRGYKAEKIGFPGVRYYTNPRYATTNILASLFSAEEALDGDTLISYSDIWYETAVVRRLLRCDKDIAIGVDIDWKEYYLGRKDHPIEEAENVIFNSANQVMKIGKIGAGQEEVHGEFIGMMKLTRRGCEILRRHYHRAGQLHAGKPFQRAARFEQAYLTDLLQEMADLGVPIHCEIIGSGWKEIDTVEDLQKAIAVFRKKETLS